MATAKLSAAHQPSACLRKRVIESTAASHIMNSIRLRPSGFGVTSPLMPRRYLPPFVLASVAYTVLAVVLTWPVTAHLSSAFPHDAFDPALNAWILWWNAHSVPLTA